MPRASSTGVRGLYRDADDRYRIDLRWRHPTTGAPMRHKERLPKSTTGAAAKERARKILDGALAGTFEPEREEDAPGATLGPSLDRYLAACETRGLRSIASRRTHAKAWRAFLGETKALDSLVAFDLERFATKAKAGGSAPATINRHATTLKHFARWAAEAGLMPKPIAAALREARTLREPAGRVRWLSEKEQRTVDEHLEGWLRPIVDAAARTGMRCGELTNLRRREVDDRRREIVLTRTKNGKPRIVPISDELAGILGALQDLGPDSYVFPIPRRSSRVAAPKRSEDTRRRDLASQAWAAFCAKHAIADLRFHDLRHDAATRIRRAGHGLDVVATVLGHSDVRTAQRYAHLGQAQIREALDATNRGPVAPSLPPGQVLAITKAEGAERIRTAV